MDYADCTDSTTSLLKFLAWHLSYVLQHMSYILAEKPYPQNRISGPLYSSFEQGIVYIRPRRTTTVAEQHWNPLQPAQDHVQGDCCTQEYSIHMHIIHIREAVGIQHR